MNRKIMHWNYKKAFIAVVVMAVVLALVSAVAVPLSLSRQISDIRALEQSEASEQAQTQQSGSDREREHGREHGDWEKNITPLTAGHYALFGSLAVLWLALGAVYWLLVVAWLYKSAVCEGMNKSLWPILGLFFNLLAVFAFLIVRDRPSRVRPDPAGAQ